MARSYSQNPKPISQLRGNPARYLPRSFVAIDFETADNGRDSACSVGLVKVTDGQIVSTTVRLIRPPRRRILYSYIHGITWADVEKQPCFAEVWPELTGLLEGAGFLVAHNSGFDRGVLNACCLSGGLKPPELAFKCTVQLARSVWKVFPTKLPNVCEFLKIPLRHHDAGSDAEACAKIVLAAMAKAEEPPSLF